jgi:preprotein translocase subunit SecE
VARDRKRAKQRRNRGGASASGRGAAATGPSSAQATSASQPVRADVPGSLDHASGEVDEFDAALVRGAGGVALPDSDAVEEAEDGSEDGLQERDEIQAPGGPPAGSGGGGGAPGHGGAATPSGAPIRGNRAVGFIRASWAELQRVQWPDRRQVTQATAVVLGFVAVAGAYLGLADYVAKEIVEFIL